MVKSKLVHLLIHAGLQSAHYVAAMQWFDHDVAVGLRQVGLIISLSVDSVAKKHPVIASSALKNPRTGSGWREDSCDEQKSVLKSTTP